MRQLLNGLKELTKFNRERLDVGIIYIKSKRYLSFLLNCHLLLVIGYYHLKAVMIGVLSRIGIAQFIKNRPYRVRQASPVLTGPIQIPIRQKVLMIVEESIPQCLRYRVEQKIEQLESRNVSARYISWKDEQGARRLLHACHIVIFYRVPGFLSVLNMIDSAKALKKIVFYDVDDIIFDRTRLEEKFTGQDALLSEHERKQLFVGADLYKKALEKCDYGIVSTLTLLEEVGKFIPKGNVFVHPNGLDKVINNYLPSRQEKLQRDFLSIFYGSGTKTHDADFRVVSGALADILAERKDVRLTIVGYLTLPEDLHKFSDRIDRIKFLDLEAYLEVLSQADINIAPLESGIFTDCKSEIKWLEAAVLGIPSVVTATRTYKEHLTHSFDAMLANSAEEWYEILNLLLNDKQLRKTIAKNASEHAQKEYSVSALGKNLSRIIKSSIGMEIHKGNVERTNNRKKLLYVNVLYPPESVGGATIVCENIVGSLHDRYQSNYNICVFTYDISTSGPYQLREYVHNGTHVTALGMPISPDIDWNYKDDRVLQIFAEYLDTVQPDLIHFHSVQRLTGSVVEAAQIANIPYVATVHDAWWLSDRQFLIDEEGKQCKPNQNDPLVAMGCSEDINRSIKRRRYLFKLLEGAKRVYAVSDYQADLYRKNGYANIKVNRNGLNVNLSSIRKAREKSSVLRIGYAGGVCVHKGYYLLKRVVTKCKLSNSRLLVLDFSMAEGEKKEADWAGTRVDFIPKLPPERMAEFYAEIDVLVAPSIWPESFGLITREAVLHGVWTVAAEAGALAEDIIPGANGDRFPVGNSDELAAILKRLDHDKDQIVPEKIKRTSTVRSVGEQVDELVAQYNAILSVSESTNYRMIQSS